MSKTTLSLFAVVLLTSAPALADNKKCKGRTGQTGVHMNLPIESGGMDRTYNLYVPPQYNAKKRTPLVFNLHGLGSNPVSQAGYTQFHEAAEVENIIVAYPKGYRASWNAGPNRAPPANEAGIDDVGFISDLIDAISADYCIDTKRVYATGLSLGGMMSYRLACELPDRIAAIAPVAGSLDFYPCDAEVPLLAFHGTDDVRVSWPDFGAPSVEYWLDANECESEEMILQIDDVTCYAGEDCDDDGAVEYCVVDGGGHNWPGAFNLCVPRPDFCWWVGHTTQAIDANDMILEFFSRFTVDDDEDDDDDDHEDDDSDDDDSDDDDD